MDPYLSGDCHSIGPFFDPLALFSRRFFEEIFKVYIIKIFEELHFLDSYGIFLREEGTFIVVPVSTL
jgi:hypothetical protein